MFRTPDLRTDHANVKYRPVRDAIPWAKMGSGFSVILQSVHFSLYTGKSEVLVKSDDEFKEERLSGQLQRLLISIEASRRAVLPKSNDALLHSIVETAAKIFGAAAASILLVNEAEEALEGKVFEVAAEKQRDFGLGDFEDFGCFGLGQPLLFDDCLNFEDNF